uniref:G_PROTEIN_RECEP_F1_2 domain-containing protein n=1 Tax=Meloidogyne hapla TaxID=6305 RepID=A0A1I8BT80_MELHA
MNITSTQYFIALLCILFPTDFVLASMLYIAGMPQAGQDKCCSNTMILQLLEWDNNPGDKFQLAQRAGGFYAIAWIFVSIFITSAYSTIFCCAYAIRRFVKQHIKNTKTKVSEINDQLTLNMIIQMMLLRLPIHWIAVLNPVVTILTVKHYKSAIHSLILRGTATIHSTTSQNTHQGGTHLGNSQNNQNGNVIIYHTPQNKMVPKSPLVCQKTTPNGSIPIMCY